MFAVELNEFDLNAGLQYFNIRLSQVEIQDGVKVEH